MARGPVAIDRGAIWPGLAVLALVLALVLGPLALVLAQAGGAGAITAADWAAVRFTLWQAALSAGLSTVLAVPVARALARRRFAGRAALVTALGAPFILPVIVAVLGLLALFGRAGILGRALTALGLPPVPIYGLQGVLVAHLFLNLPLAVRMILNGWAAIPPERFRLAAALGLAPRDVARLIERPMLRATLPGVALSIFLVCLTSFTVILIMGGGPRATSLGLAIYQAFRLEFALGHAASLAALQLALGLAATGAGLMVLRPAAFGAGRGLASLAPPADPKWLARIADALAIALLALFLALPVGLAALAGLAHLPGLEAEVLRAGARSMVIALAASALATAGALLAGQAIAHLPARSGRLADAAAMLALGVSPLVIGTGAFLAIRPFADPVRLALPVTLLANALMAFPFALRILAPDLAALRADYGRLSQSLGLTGRARLRLVTLPRLRRPLAFAAGLSAALSMGDLGVITLFSDPAQATLPALLYQRMGQYRMDEAYGISALLMGLSFGLFWAFDRMGRKDADA
ncbi:MAG: thiamine/thiamine pyrophosphate ABC transporter permease ThiP [Proteobacteria bacterium]|nr:thiamine/thiamine pyrophosphate ABC transporter permease ThiP [Pseudomonadota bacterium]MBS0572064.1 thiamine/thiamine pyrophosphate ABC transporter permease ThiP [Pseudomonadota bacterium]